MSGDERKSRTIGGRVEDILRAAAAAEREGSRRSSDGGGEVVLASAAEDADARGRRWTYTQLWERCGALAAAVRRRCGVRRGDTVALLCHNSAASLAWFFVPSLLGALLAPLNVRWSAALATQALADCDALVLVHDAALSPLARQLAKDVGGLTGKPPLQLVCIQDWWAAASENSEPMAPGGGSDGDDDDDDRFGIFFTSGTAGSPKGAVLTHGNMIVQAYAKLAHVGYAAGDVFLHALPLFHVGGASSTLAVTLARATHVVAEGVAGFDAAGIMRLVDAHRVTAIALVPTMLAALCDEFDSVRRPLDGLQRVLIGAGGVSAALQRRSEALMPNAALIEAYGMTEAASSITFLERRSSAAGSAPSPPPPAGDVGRPAAHVQLRILGNGELATRGPHVMRGYHRRASLTRRRLDAASGWFRTGDLAEIDARSGHVRLRGRLEDVIRSGGENVHAVDVERVLAEHRRVAACAVFALPHDRLGEQVSAAVQLHGDQLGAAASAAAAAALRAELQALCRRSLAAFMAPRRIEFVAALPRNSSGKVLKAQLQRQFATAAPDSNAAAHARL